MEERPGLSSIALAAEEERRPLLQRFDLSRFEA